MARRRSGRGSGGFFGKVMWALLILCLVFAWFKTPIPAGSTVTTIQEFAVAKSHAMDTWIHSLNIPGMNGSAIHPAPSAPATPAPETTPPAP